jgi:hypothetical protein
VNPVVGTSPSPASSSPVHVAAPLPAIPPKSSHQPLLEAIEKGQNDKDSSSLFPFFLLVKPQFLSFLLLLHSPLLSSKKKLILSFLFFHLKAKTTISDTLQSSKPTSEGTQISIRELSAKADECMNLLPQNVTAEPSAFLQIGTSMSNLIQATNTLISKLRQGTEVKFQVCFSFSFSFSFSSLSLSSISCLTPHHISI